MEGQGQGDAARHPQLHRRPHPGALELLRQDGITGLRAWVGMLWYMWVRPGMMRKIAAPGRNSSCPASIRGTRTTGS